MSCGFVLSVRKRLAGDVADALGVRCPNPRRLVAEPQQQLLVKGQIVCGALSLVCHGPSVESSL